MIRRIFGSPTVFLVAFVAVAYAAHLAGIARINNDTFVYFYPWRAYLGDALRQGIFPFWDPFSSPGVPTADFGNSTVYYPVAVVLGLLARPTPDWLIAEIALTAVVCVLGVYWWLRGQRVAAPLAAAGAIGYTGSAVVLTKDAVFATQISMSFAPYLLMGIDYVLSEDGGRRELGLGTLVLVCAVWLMSTGGYLGHNYISFIVAALYAVTTLHWTRRSLGRALLALFGTSVLVGGLLFLPLSEFASLLLGQVREIRGFTSDADGYTGSLLAWAPLTLWLASGCYLPGMIAGIGQLYMGALLILTLPAGAVTAGLKRREILYLALAGAILLASMGPFSPLARALSDYLPGFRWVRWRAGYGAWSVLFLVAVSARVLDRFLAGAVHDLRLRRRYLGALALTTFAGCALAFVPLLMGSAVSFEVSLYHWTALLSGLGLSAAVILFWFRAARKGPAAPDLRPLRRLSMCTVAAVALLALLMRGWPEAWLPASWLSSFAALTQASPRTIELTAHQALLGLADLASLKGLSVGGWTILALDVLQAAGLAALFAFAVARHHARGAAWLGATVLVLVFCDLAVSAQRYRAGNSYWVTSQVPRALSPRSSSVTFDRSNLRDPNYGHRFAPSWDVTGGYENVALQYRVPTFLSYGPIADKRTVWVMQQPGGVDVFRKLLWLLPANVEVSVSKWQEVAIEPRTTSLALEPNRLRVVVTSAASGRLVWTDTWAHGWKAWVNGRPVRVLRALRVAKAVEIPAGESTVVFEYRPRLLREGLTLMGLSLLGMLALLAVALRSEKRETGEATVSRDRRAAVAERADP